MKHRVSYIPLVFTAVALFWMGGGMCLRDAQASDWLPGSPADASVSQWVTAIDHELNKAEHQAAFLNDPRSPIVPMINLFNRAAQARQDNNLPLAQDFVRQALHIIDQGVAKGYYAEADVAPMKKAILAQVPLELGGAGRGAAGATAMSGQSAMFSRKEPAQGGRSVQRGPEAGTAKDLEMTNPNPSTLSEKEQLAQLGRMGLGVPEPGTAMDLEQTNKRRNPSNDHTADRNAQINLGGARYFVSGQPIKIEGEHYYVRDDDSGDAIRLVVNKDSHLLCAPGTGRGQAAIGKQDGELDKTASPKQIAQGQKQDETAIGAGFVIGTSNCFESGDRIRAEVSDEGIVTLLRYLTTEQPSLPVGARSLGKSAGTGVLALSNAELGMSTQDKPGQLDMTTLHGYPPKEYAVKPVPGGKFIVVTDSPWPKAPVKSSDEKTIGRIESLIKDSESGRIEYIEVSLAGEGVTRVLPRTYFRPGPKRGMIVLDDRQYQLMPAHTMQDGKEPAPSVEEIKHTTLTPTAPADLQPLADRKAAREEASKLPRPTPKQLPKGKLIAGPWWRFPNRCSGRHGR
jgi:hypothetical protein